LGATCFAAAALRTTLENRLLGHKRRKGGLGEFFLFQEKENKLKDASFTAKTVSRIIGFFEEMLTGFRLLETAQEKAF